MTVRLTGLFLFYCVEYGLYHTNEFISMTFISTFIVPLWLREINVRVMYERYLQK